MPTGTMFDPPIKGHTKLSSPSYSFLIEHESLERKVLFDMGAPKNWHTVPELVEEFKESRWDIQVEKDVAEILEEHGVLANDIDAMIWR